MRTFKHDLELEEVQQALKYAKRALAYRFDNDIQIVIEKLNNVIEKLDNKHR